MVASRFRSIHDTTPASTSIQEILQEVKSTQPIRSDSDKARLPLYSPHEMTAATDESVVTHSGLFVFDVDSLAEVPIESREQIKHWLSRDEFVHFVYLTMRGLHFGVQVAVTPNTTPELHAVLHEVIQGHFQAAYEAQGFMQKVKWDPQVANLGRRMYIHGDPALWVRKSPSQFLGHGNRNSQLTSLYGRYATYRQDAPALLHKINSVLKKPLSEAELTGIIDSIGRIHTSSPKGSGTRLHQQIDAVRSWFGKKLMYDVYKDALIFDNKAVSDEIVTFLRTELERETKIAIPRVDFREFVNVVGEERPYDWFKDWLEAEVVDFTWDLARVGHAFVVCIAERPGEKDHTCEKCPRLSDDQYRWAGRWLQLLIDGVVGRNILPGARFPYIPYILGGQGVSKSDMLKVLAGGNLTEDNYALVPSMEFYKGDIDTIYASQGVLVFEDGEAMVSARAQHNAQKRFATETVDRGLKKWKVIKSEKLRRYVVVVTSNERQHFPKGETRRFPVLDLPTNTKLNIKWLIDMRPSLLRSRYRALKKEMPQNASALILEEEWWPIIEDANTEFTWTDEMDDYAEDIKTILATTPQLGGAHGARSRDISSACNKKIRELKPSLEYVGLVSKVVKTVEGSVMRMWVIKDSHGPYTVRNVDEAGNWD